MLKTPNPIAQAQFAVDICSIFPHTQWFYPLLQSS